MRGAISIKRLIDRFIDLDLSRKLLSCTRTTKIKLNPVMEAFSKNGDKKKKRKNRNEAEYKVCLSEFDQKTGKKNSFI